jgi:NAD(P)-dependent dehydrogenase (short-subunit alcohol dehydrogenase family)
MRRSVLVSGTSTGIGSACVRRLANKGWTVFAGVRRRTDGERLVSEVTGDVRPILLDVADREQIERAVADVGDAAGGGLDGLVNNAGIACLGPVEHLPLADWRWQFEVNLFGMIALTQAAFDLIRVKGGRFVYIGSQAGRFSPPGMAPYAASKHALEALCESMRHELAATPMRVCLVEPGNVKTPVWDKATEGLQRIESMVASDDHEDYAVLAPALAGLAQEGATRGVSPSKVAAKVEHALTAARPRARYLVGADAKVVGTVLTRLPDLARDRVVSALTRRLAHLGSDHITDQDPGPRSSGPDRATRSRKAV